MSNSAQLPAEETPTQAGIAFSADFEPGQPQAKSAGDLPPLLFGRYRLIRELGRGGMGVVMQALDEVLGISVALKMVPEQVLRDTEGLADLKKEVLRGMALTHPGIVRVHSFEQDATCAAIVMECVEGETLASLKVRQPDRCFDCEKLLPWVKQLCAALDYAHQDAFIAHRDLKPANLLLTAAQRLKIADFGIASSLSDTLTRISVRSDTAGTPAYMSPQQAMGERPSHLDDFYSLGATLYELLTGKPPFFRGNILAQTLQEKPSSMAQRRAEFKIIGRTAIPEPWEKLVMACLAKSPESRPASGAAALAILSEPIVVTVKSQEALQKIAVKPALTLPVVEAATQQELLPACTVEKSVLAAPVFSIIKFNKQRRGSGRFPLPEWTRTFLLVTAAAALTAGGLHKMRSYLENQTPIAANEPKATTPAPSATMLDSKDGRGTLRRDSLPLKGAVFDRINEVGKKFK